MDGSSLGNPGRSGFGSLVRNMKGDWIIGFSGACGITNNVNAELLAILNSLKIAWNSGYTNII